MTREELKAHCKRQLEQFERVEKIMPVTPNDWKRYEEHKMVLELLEQEPCDDCISRQAVKDKYRESLINNLTDADRGIDLSKYAEEPYKAFCEFINSMPSVTPQPKTECSCEQIKWERDTAIAQLKELGYGLGEKPKTGHWVHFASGDDCSECGWSTGKYISPSDYCPKCGARMVEPAESEEEE